LNNVEKSKRRQIMRKIAVLALVFAVVMGSSMAFAGSLTDKVDKLIDTNQTRLERSYNLRDMRPNQLSIELGPPLFVGAAYSYNINEMFAFKVGAGTTAPGLAADLGIVVYILPSTIAPYATGGIVYYTDLTQNIIALNVGAGVDVQLDNAFGIQLGLDWVKSITNAGAPFHTASFNDSVNWLNISGGISFRM
jgi:hypothetical protein